MTGKEVGRIGSPCRNSGLSHGRRIKDFLANEKIFYEIHLLFTKPCYAKIGEGWTMSEQAKILARLRELQIPFEEYHHAAAHTMEDCLALPYAAPDVTFCKNILLCNRQQTAFYLYVTQPEKPFRTADVSKLLGTSRLSFAPTELLPQMLHLQSGSLSPLALYEDPDRRIALVLDRGILRGERIAFHPCDNTATVIFTLETFRERVIPSLQHEPVWLTVP